MCRLVAASAVLFGSLLFGQSGDIAKQVYSNAQDSVFLVYLNDSGGAPTALGSAFLVAPRTLITNAHVVSAGAPVLAVGPVRVPLKVIRTDEKNDLAVLSVDVELTSKPLSLASEDMSPGEQIFAIGNPEGLEKTISQGIVSGLRHIGDRDLLQITSPISHGSSGGPILNSRGEVIGVAVGALEDGQNLNFAVPVKFVRTILAQNAAAVAPFNLEESLGRLRNLAAKRQQAQYSDDASSDYQETTQQLLALMGKITDSTVSEEALSEIACLGTKAFDYSDLGIKAARKLVQAKPTTTNRALLAYVLFDRAEDENFKAAMARKDSDEQSRANTAHGQFVSEANEQASYAATQGKGDQLLIADFVLGEVKNDNGNFTEAISLHSHVASGKAQVCGVDLNTVAIRDLISESKSANRPDDAEKWFREYASLNEPAPYEWDSEGDSRNDAKDYSAAADAYERAAKGNDYYGYDLCYAAVDRYLQPVTDADAVLGDGQSCIDASVKESGKDDEHYFKSEMPMVYRLMAEVLEQRGVYQKALEYVKESLDLAPNNAFALNTEAKIFDDEQRYPECITAAQSAIAASDGKFPWMHFELGSCSFATQNWTQAAASFRIAAESNTSDAVSAFNLGLSLSRQGFTTDADHWFREALNRKPDAELRAKILNALR